MKAEITQRESGAWHEAGHVVMCEILRPGSVVNAGIGPGSSGHVAHQPLGDDRKEALVAAAGPAAERMAGGPQFAWESPSDERGMDRYLPSKSAWSHYRSERAQLIADAARQLRPHWPMVEAVARALLARGKLTGGEARVLLGTGQPRAAAPAPPAGYTSMTRSEMFELRAQAQAKGQERLVRALNLTLTDGPPKMEMVKWTFPAEFRIQEEW